MPAQAPARSSEQTGRKKGKPKDRRSLTIPNDMHNVESTARNSTRSLQVDGRAESQSIVARSALLQPRVLRTLNDLYHCYANNKAARCFKYFKGFNKSLKNILLYLIPFSLVSCNSRYYIIFVCQRLQSNFAGRDCDFITRLRDKRLYIFSFFLRNIDL